MSASAGASIGVEAAFAPLQNSGHFVGSSIGVEAAFANVSPMLVSGSAGGSTGLPPGASIGVEAAFANVAPPQGGSVNLFPLSDGRDFWGTSIGVEAAFADAKGGRLPSGASAMVAAAPFGGASVDVNGAFAEYSPFNAGFQAGPMPPSSATTGPLTHSAVHSAAGNSISVDQRLMDDMSATPRRLASFRRPEGAIVVPAPHPSEAGFLAAAIRGPARFQSTMPGPYAAEAVQAERLVLPDPRSAVPTTYGYPAGPQRYPVIIPSAVPAPVAAPISSGAEFLQYAYHAPNFRYEAKNAQAVQVPVPVLSRSVAATGPSAGIGVAAIPGYAAPPPAVMCTTVGPPQYMSFTGIPSASGLTAVAPVSAGPGRTYTAPLPISQTASAALYRAPVPLVAPAKAATYTPPMTTVQSGSTQNSQYLVSAPPPTATYSRPTGITGAQTPSYTAPSKSTYVPPPTYAIQQHTTAAAFPAHFAIANVPSYRGPPVTSPMAPWRDFRPTQ